MQRLQCVRILGVDPGSRLTGYGCVDLVGNQIRHVTHGTLRLSNTGGRAEIPLERRLLLIHEGLAKIIHEFSPHVLAVERVFFAKNAVSALKLGQARGVALLAGAIHSLNVVEYSPTQIKATVVGHGQADKDQVAKMVKLLTGCGEFSTNDASDALALAVCHAHHLISVHAFANAAGRAAVAEARTSASPAQAPRKVAAKRLSLAEAVGLTPEMVAGQRRVKARNIR